MAIVMAQKEKTEEDTVYDELWGGFNDVWLDFVFRLYSQLQAYISRLKTIEILSRPPLKHAPLAMSRILISMKWKLRV